MSMDEFSMVQQMADRLSASDLYKDVLGALDAARLKSWSRLPVTFVLLPETQADEAASAVVGGPQHMRLRIGLNSLISAPNDRTGTCSRDTLSRLVGTRQAKMRSCSSRVAFWWGWKAVIWNGGMSTSCTTGKTIQMGGRQHE